LRLAMSARAALTPTKSISSKGQRRQTARQRHVLPPPGAGPEMNQPGDSKRCGARKQAGAAHARIRFPQPPVSPLGHRPSKSCA
jgi:hypothetical protein